MIYLIVLAALLSGCSAGHFVLFDIDYAPIGYETCMSKGVKDAEGCYQEAKALGRRTLAYGVDHGIVTLNRGL
jgi:hypothetical protein